MLFKSNVLLTHISTKQLRLQGSVKYSPKLSYMISPTLLVGKAQSVVVLVVSVVNETYVE